jgi:hypothetical protein
MIAQHFLGSLIGYSIGFAILAVFSLLRRQMWLRRADRLARQSGIALPLWIEDRVARFLRNEFFFGQFVALLTTPALSTLVVATMAGGNWGKWLPWILVSIPLYLIVVGSVTSLWPRWKASSRYRVTHLGSVSTRHAFTSAEFAAVVIGAILGLALSAWGLRHVAAPATWWLAFAAAAIAAFGAWRRAAWGIMNRPSSASDEIELGWDDLLRFRQVRGLTAAAAWGPTVMVYVIDCVMASAFTRNFTGPNMMGVQIQWWPILLPIATLVLLSLLFRQGRGLWRRAWLDRNGLG